MELFESCGELLLQLGHELWTDIRILYKLDVLHRPRHDSFCSPNCLQVRKVEGLLPQHFLPYHKQNENVKLVVLSLFTVQHILFLNERA